jgi:hypothetical protein
MGDGAGALRKTAYDAETYTLTRFRAQALAARYALPIEHAAIVAPLALGGAHG